MKSKPLAHALARLGMVCCTAVVLTARGEVFEIGPSNKHLLPKGKEADGIVGDFVLRNDRVEALVSGNLPLRRANMGTFYGTNGITPGCLYDLTLRDRANDQLTVFAPCDQRGPVSYVRVSGVGDDAVIETVTTAASNNGLYKRHEFKLLPGWPGVLITTTLSNVVDEARIQSIDDRWGTFLTNGVFRGIRWADAVDPADRVGYAYCCTNSAAQGVATNRVELKPGEQKVLSRFLAVGESPAEAVGIAVSRQAPVGRISAELLELEGHPAATATVRISYEDQTVCAYPGPDGKFLIPFPAGTYEIVIQDAGRETIRQSLEVRENQIAELRCRFSRRAALAFEITDEQGRELPCKAQVIGVDGTPSPDFGPPNRAHGCRDQYHSENGRFTLGVAPGRYEVIVTRGIEFSYFSRKIEVLPGEAQNIKCQLKRLVDTRGWVSADYHNHSTPSGDNTCGTDDRIINLAAEHVEFAPTTEHNRLFDWRPNIERLGLTKFLTTVSGVELTGSGPHLNSFPFRPNPDLQDGGAPVWNPDPRVSAILLRNHQERDPDRWIQVNHPDLIEDFVDSDGDGLADGGFVGLGGLVDAIEVENFIDSTILSPYPFRIYADENTQKGTVIENRAFIWLQLLNRGHHLVGMAVSDAHSVHGNGVGGWRMYLPSRSDEPNQIDWRENSRHARAGRSTLTTGPFLEVQTADSILPGGLARVNGGVTLQIKVQCTDWIDIDRVQILVNGRARKELNFTRKSHPDWFQNGVLKFAHDVRVPLSEDAHLIVVAYGEGFNLALGYGSSDQAKLKPCAFNNPIFIDVDGGGFTPNGDSLGFPMVGKKPSLELARQILAGR